MFGKNYFTILLAIACFFAGSVAISAQTAPTRGTVVMVNADNTTTPVAGAMVETFRTDIKQKGQTAKTDSKGRFQFAGLQLGATYLFSVSGAGITPKLLPGVKAGNESLVINVIAGDGKRYTEAEARDALKAPPATTGTTGTTGQSQQQTAAADPAKPAELTAAQKKEKEEFDKKYAETDAKNKKVQQGNEIVAASFKEGNEASAAKNYDLAITKFDTGITAVPDFIGSTPALLNGKGAALRLRAVQKYNANIKSTDATAKLQAMGEVKKDLAAAVDAYNQAWNLVKNAPAADLAANPNAQNFKKDTISGAGETFRIMAATEQVEAPQIEIAKVLIPEYLTTVTDPAEKAKSQVILGDLYRVSNDSENAVVEYKKVLDATPDNIDALSGIGFSLVNLGYLNSDKTKMQEGANFLQKFYAAAPDTNKYKEDAKNTIDLLKKEQNLTPQKLPAKKKG